jgi:cardiolipin synthase
MRSIRCTTCAGAGASGPPARRRLRLPSATWRRCFVTRDNQRHRTSIERHYRAAIATARERIVIANAYFFPGYRLLRDLRDAARRGVDVRLILQGEPDMPIVQLAARLLYDDLLRAGVCIYEYCERPFHGKVALVDGEWATVGSSNLDPFSLSLNLEANLVVRDGGFNRRLYERLENLMHRHCTQIDPATAARAALWRPVASALAFHFMRRFPHWVQWLPEHRPNLTVLQSPPPEGAWPADPERRA